MTGCDIINEYYEKFVIIKGKEEMVSIAIVEDEKSQVQVIKKLLAKFFSEKHLDCVIDVYSNGVEFLEHFDEKYDIVMMDIEMPVLDGMETARKIRKINSSVIIIFVTNMAQFAINGYEVDAMGFLLKPVSYFGLSMILQKALNSLSKRNSVDILVRSRQGLTVIPSSALFYVEVQKHDLFYYTESGSVSCRGTLKDIEEKLRKVNFVRCNNCYLVNMKFIVSIDMNTVCLPKKELQISRSKKKEFLEAVMKYFGGESNV